MKNVWMLLGLYKGKGDDDEFERLTGLYTRDFNQEITWNLSDSQTEPEIEAQRND